MIVILVLHFITKSIFVLIKNSEDPINALSGMAEGYITVGLSESLLFDWTE